MPVVIGTSSNDMLSGTTGDDAIYGLGGNDVIYGFEGADQLFGGDGDDALSGGDGNDFLDGGPGGDTMDGGAGDDTYFVDSPLDVVVELQDQGFDTVISSIDFSISANPGNYAVQATIENLALIGAATLGVGNQYANVITGNAADNVIYGYGGDDTLLGAGGDDLLNGSSGNDVLDGGNGSDTADYFIAEGPVTVSLALSGPQDTGGDGTDTLISIENLAGSLFDDTLIGDSGDNWLDGRGGNDTLYGNEGADTANYRSAVSGVIVDLRLAGPQDTSGAGTDTLISIENVHGSTLDDRLTGNSFANTIGGDAGIDILTGGGGADTFRDTIAGFNGDTITDFSRSDMIVFTDADLETFSFWVTGNQLIFDGGSLTLDQLTNPSLIAGFAPGGGVSLYFAGPPVIISAGDSVHLGI